MMKKKKKKKADKCKTKNMWTHLWRNEAKMEIVGAEYEGGGRRFLNVNQSRKY
jgi:hypothetical protein